jgi:hypothetical protein
MKKRRWAKVAGVRVLDAMRIPHRFRLTPDHTLARLIEELDGAPPIRGWIAILAMRSGSWYEFAAYSAVWFRRLGYGTILLYSSRDLDHCYGKGETRLEHVLTGSFPRHLFRIPDMILQDVDAWPCEPAVPDPGLDAWAVSYATTAAAYDLRVEEQDGTPVVETYESLKASYVEQYRRVRAGAEAHLLRLIQTHGVRRLVTYSGLIGDTPAFGAAARACGMDVVFCEGWSVKPGHMICSYNQPAMTYDVASWLTCLEQIGDTRYLKDVESFLKFQETNDVSDAEWLQNYHQFQRSKAQTALPEELKAFLSGAKKVFLLAPNCVGDSATLRVETAFPNQRAWLRFVCDWFARHPEHRLIIRAHPDELNLENNHRLRIRMGDVARSLSAGIPNIYVIEGRQAVSSYALIPHVQAGLIWMSTIGVDLVIRSVPVLAAARPKYSGLGIVQEPATAEAYAEALDRLSDPSPPPTAAQLLMAKKYLAILSKEFSYEAFTCDYRLHDLSLNGHPEGGESETFYRMLCGELPIPTRPRTRALQS